LIVGGFRVWWLSGWSDGVLEYCNGVLGFGACNLGFGICFPCPALAVYLAIPLSSFLFSLSFLWRDDIWNLVLVIWNLEFVCLLVLVIWDLFFGICLCSLVPFRRDVVCDLRFIFLGFVCYLGFGIWNLFVYWCL